MAISKTSQYSIETLRSAAIYHALAHPARVTIANLVSKGKQLTNKDLTGILKLTEPTVHFHLKKMADAGLIRFEFHPTYGIVKPGKLLKDSFISDQI